jgi:hypothetical protein
MAESNRTVDRAGDGSTAEPPVADLRVTAHSTRPGHVVFTEAENDDGWIATDLTVDPPR